MDAHEIKHDNIVNLVEMELRSRGHKYNYQHVTYKHLYKMPGEIDLICLPNNSNYVLIFEIKGSYNRHAHNKAIKQLDHAEKYIMRHYYRDANRVFKFFVYPEDGEIKYNWIRHKEVKKW